jgi:hypothetical protein
MHDTDVSPGSLARLAEKVAEYCDQEFGDTFRTIDRANPHALGALGYALGRELRQRYRQSPSAVRGRVSDAEPT